MREAARDDQYWPTGDVVPGHSSWRSQRSHAGGGALLEHSIHAADVCNWLFGRPTEVFAKQRSLFGYDVEDAAALTIDHESGVIGNLVTVFHGGRGREERRLDPADLRSQHFAAMGVTRPDVFFYRYIADRAWVDAVRAGRPASPGFADALAAHALVEAAYQSAQAGRAIRLERDVAAA